MAYKALYRTYRPQKFSEVVGQDVIVRTLQNSIINKRTSHAYLFCGPRGTGKTTIARIFAKVLNCQNKVNDEPCCSCTSCLEIANGTSCDVIEIDAASNNGVDEIREIKDKVKFLPAGSLYKIYIIDEVHMLSNSAFNALLKTLEEPPQHAIFVLATTEPHKVIPTILSRCQRFDFKALLSKDLEKSLQSVCEQENVKYENEALECLALASEGGFRDALSYLDQAIALSDDVITYDIASSITGLVKVDVLVRLANAIENKDILNSLEIINSLINEGKEVSKIISSMLTFYKNILLYKVLGGENEEFRAFSELVTERKVYFNVEILSDTIAKFKYQQTLDIYFEVAIIRMINTTNDDLDYAKRITDLEKKIANGITDGAEAFPLEVKRIKALEDKFTYLLTELSKLEIPKLIEKVKFLEANTKPQQVTQESVSKELVNRVDKIIEDLELLKVIQNTFRNELENTKTGSIDENLLQEKIDESVKKNKGTINFTEIESFIKKKLEQFEPREVNNDQLDQKINEIESLITSLDSTKLLVSKLEQKINNPVDEERIIKRIKEEILISPNLSSSNFNEEAVINRILKEVKTTTFDEEAFLNKIKQEINNNSVNINYDEIISKVKKDINISPSTYSSNDLLERVKMLENNVYKLMADLLSQPPKKERKKVDDKQISLWKDEIVTVDKISAVDETKIDFQELAKDDFEVEEEFNETEELQTEVIEEKEIVKKPSRKTRLEDDNLFTRRDDIPNTTQTEFVEEIQTEVENLGEVEKPVEVEKQTEVVQEKVIEKVAKVVEEKPVEVVEKVLKTPTEQKEYKEVDDVIQNVDNDLDEYERFDVKVLERIMNDSFSSEFMNEKQRLNSIWKHLIPLAPVEKRGVAELLSEGEIKVVGNREFVITYPTAALCNQVMSRKFKRNSLKLLFDILDGDYNYFSIPLNIWEEKRREYANQYYVGTKHPTLTPIDCKELRIPTDDEDNEDNKILENIIEVFGSGVNIKK